MAVEVSITVTVPKSLLNDAQVRAEIERTLKADTTRDLKAQFDKTVEGWLDKPSFSQRFTNRVDYLSVTVFASGPNADTYALVNAGAPAHTITPRRGGLLRFQPGYQAATRPRVIGSRAKRRSGAYIATMQVQHPGFEAREFDQVIAETVDPKFRKDIQDAIARASRR